MSANEIPLQPFEEKDGTIPRDLIAALSTTYESRAKVFRILPGETKDSLGAIKTALEGLPTFPTMPEQAVFNDIMDKIDSAMLIKAGPEGKSKVGLGKGMGPAAGPDSPPRTTLCTRVDQKKCPGVSRCIVKGTGHCIYRQCLGNQASTTKSWNQVDEVDQVIDNLKKLYPSAVTLNMITRWTETITTLQVDNPGFIAGGFICHRHTKRGALRWQVFSAAMKAILQNNCEEGEFDELEIYAGKVDQYVKLGSDPSAQDTKAAVAARDAQMTELTEKIDELERENLATMHALSDLNNPDYEDVDNSAMLDALRDNPRMTALVAKIDLILNRYATFTVGME